MSLISDPECVIRFNTLTRQADIIHGSYLIHSLRLSYLRNVDDPYGARLITLDPSYHSNPYILAASFADVERWPELAMPSSPPISDDERESSSRPSGFPGATGLKHSQTIMGPRRSGALGLRVSGKRASMSKRHSGTPRPRDGHNIYTDAASAHDSTPTTKPTDTQVESWVQVANHDSSASEVSTQLTDDMASPEPPAKGIHIPKFKYSADMEAKRKMRMQARRGPIATETKTIPTVAASLNPELSSSDDDDEDSMSDDDDFEEITETGDDMDDGDEFDP
jgi:target of rapamycin complex 2 subunit MAPKAP1